jgi:hypothetical protein
MRADATPIWLCYALESYDEFKTARTNFLMMIL